MWVGWWGGSVGREGTQVPSRTPIPRQQDAITAAPAAALPPGDALRPREPPRTSWFEATRGGGGKGGWSAWVWALRAHHTDAGWLVLPAMGGRPGHRHAPPQHMLPCDGCWCLLSTSSFIPQVVNFLSLWCSAFYKWLLSYFLIFNFLFPIYCSFSLFPFIIKGVPVLRLERSSLFSG